LRRAEFLAAFVVASGRETKQIAFGVKRDYPADSFLRERQVIKQFARVREFVKMSE
jgi:hypothetical protein